MFRRMAIALSTATLLSIGMPMAVHADDDLSPEMAEALKVLDAQLPGNLINNPYDIEWRTDGSDKRNLIVKSEDAPGGMAYQVSVKKRKRNPWDVAIRIPMSTSIEKDDVILMSFWARTVKPQKGNEAGDITVSIQKNSEPYDSVFNERLDIGKEWKLYSVSGKAGLDYNADKTNINFNLAHAKQKLEFGQFYIMNLGKNADASKYID